MPSKIQSLQPLHVKIKLKKITVVLMFSFNSEKELAQQVSLEANSR
jgi:hypothetical protein